MANIMLLSDYDADKLRLVKKSLLGLRNYYPGFQDWFDTKILPNVNKSRKVLLAMNNGEFSGALILKLGNEKKICTLFVNEQNRHKNLGLDFLRIASEELETYKMSITFNEEVKNFFLNNNHFNFYTTNISDKYLENSNEYQGYIMYRNPDKELRKNYERSL